MLETKENPISTNANGIKPHFASVVTFINSAVPCEQTLDSSDHQDAGSQFEEEELRLL